MIRILITFLIMNLILMLSIQSCSDDPVSPVTTGTINGTVLDAETGMPISMVSISTNPGTIAITTDSVGEYNILNVEQGNYAIRASKLEYKANSVNVIVKPGGDVQADIVLQKEYPENVAPLPPSNPTPVNGTSNQPLFVSLTWSCQDHNEGDTLAFCLYLGSENSPVSLFATNITDTTFSLDSLNYASNYYWQIAATDKDGAKAYGPVWSFSTEPFPDNRLFFASNRDGNYAIYSASIDGESIIKLTSGHNRNWWPRINPNGDKIAFTSDHTVESMIYTMSRTGNKLQKINSFAVAGNHNYGVGFCWSPDGSQLLFSHYEKLYRINEDGTNLKQIAIAPVGKNFRECDWSPLGGKIVALTIGSWMYDSELWLMDTDGGNLQVLMGDSLGAMASPAFAPDGKKIVFTYDVSGHEVNSGRQLDSRIFVLRVDGSDTTDISTNKPAGTNDFYPRWSPDGAKIIFCNGANDDVTPKNVCIMDANGANREMIIENAIMPDWR